MKHKPEKSNIWSAIAADAIRQLRLDQSGAPSPGGAAGDFTLRDEANAIVAVAFRNGPIEDLHAGKHSALLEDTTLSRITDPEMKAIMIAACRKVEELLRLRGSDPEAYARLIRDSNERYCRNWER